MLQKICFAGYVRVNPKNIDLYMDIFWLNIVQGKQVNPFKSVTCVLQRNGFLRYINSKIACILDIHSWPTMKVNISYTYQLRSSDEHTKIRIVLYDSISELKDIPNRRSSDFHNLHYFLFQMDMYRSFQFLATLDSILHSRCL